MINLHFPLRFFGTAPRGLMMRLGRGGVGKGPAVWRAVHSLRRYSWITCGRASAD